MKNVEKRTISIILLFIISTMLIGILCSCNNDPYSISRSEFAEIKTAWADRRGEQSTFAEKRQDIKYQEIALAGMYKKYDDCMVLISHGNAAWYAEITIGQYEFKCPGCTIWVCKDSTYYLLKEAYEQNILNDDQIAKLEEIHNKVFGYNQ